MTSEITFNLCATGEDCEVEISYSTRVYECKCDGCGDSLGFTADVDSDNDVIVTIKPCGTCLVEAKAEGYSDARSDLERESES